MITSDPAHDATPPAPSLPSPPSSHSQTGVVTDAWLIIPLFNEAAVVREVIEQARAVFP